MTESYGYYTYGDIKLKTLQGKNSWGFKRTPRTLHLVSKNANSYKTEMAKNYDTSESLLTVSKNAICHETSLVKAANSHFNSTDMTTETKSYGYDILDTKNIQVSTTDIGFYEITTVGQIARHNLSIIPIPLESTVKINDVEQSSYNGYETEEINYEVSCDGYTTRSGNIKLIENTELEVILKIQVLLTINVDQENAVVIVNGVEGKEHILGQGDEVNVEVTCNGYKKYTNTFIIEEDTVLDVVLEKNIITVVYPGSTLPSTVTTSGIGSSSSSAFYNSGSSLYSNSGSYGVNNGSSYAYIKFTTPNETTTVSVQAYVSSEANYDYGGVYVGTKEYRPAKSAISGKTTDGYGSWLMSSSGSNSSYSTYTKTLSPNTTYYINFSYAKDGSGHKNSDRIFIKNITFKTYGV